MPQRCVYREARQGSIGIQENGGMTMITKEKKIKGSKKSKKKISTPAKSRSKAKDDVCMLDDVLINEQLYCCDDECCCVI